MADQRPRLEAVIFDMDGLLVDTETLSERAWRELLGRDFGVVPDETDRAWFAAIVGKSGPDSWASVRDHFGLALAMPRGLPEHEREYRAIYERILAEGVDPLPGVIDLVHACHDAGLRLGIASSSRLAHIEHIVEQLGLAPLFDALTSGKEVPRSKPDPAIYRLACQRLGVEPVAAVAIEDSGSGVMAARDAGLRCLAVPSEYTAAHDFSLASAVRPSLIGVTPADLAALPWEG